MKQIGLYLIIFAIIQGDRKFSVSLMITAGVHRIFDHPLLPEYVYAHRCVVRIEIFLYVWPSVCVRLTNGGHINGFLWTLIWRILWEICRAVLLSLQVGHFWRWLYLKMQISFCVRYDFHLCFEHNRFWISLSYFVSQFEQILSFRVKTWWKISSHCNTNWIALSTWHASTLLRQSKSNQLGDRQCGCSASAFSSFTSPSFHSDWILYPSPSLIRFLGAYWLSITQPDVTTVRHTDRYPAC